MGWFGRVIQQLLLKRDLSAQVDAALIWISGVARENDIILIEFPTYRAQFYFEFPLAYGGRPRKLSHDAGDNAVTFIIRKPDPENVLVESWIKIFSSPTIEIFEKKSRIVDISPLRWGLIDDEKKRAFKIARDALERFLSNSGYLGREYFSRLPNRFHLVANLDVMIWVKGHLRGSIVIEDGLGEGIAKAAILAARDQRFKPLSYEELQDTRIEITLIHEPYLPISKLEKKNKKIYSEKGYLLKHERRKGWFLPEIHNIRNYKNLDNFIGDLAEEKAGLPRSESEKAKVYFFEVDDFIETENHQHSLRLLGPVSQIESTLTPKFIEQRLKMAADWVCRIQEPDGNIPPIINTLTGYAVKQIDWPRLAFVALSLAEFGKAMADRKYIRAAKKTFEYIKENLTQKIIEAPSYFTPNPTSWSSALEFHPLDFELTLAYFGKLALSLQQQKDVSLVAEKILKRVSNLEFDPITFSQIVGFLNQLNIKTDLAQTLEKEFDTKLASSEPINLAAWAELALFYPKVAKWLKKQQLPNGAFPESTVCDFTYTRGTGKIFEVLALDFEENKETIEKVLVWLLSLQYNKENVFFVQTEISSKIIGGLRHDYLNQQLWIDSAGHLLLGGARLHL